MSYLTTALPDGLGFTNKCLQWLPHLAIFEWDELLMKSTRYTVEDLMRILSVDYYHAQKDDMRIFLTIGTLVSLPSFASDPPEMNSIHWIPSLVELLREYSSKQIYQDAEKAAASKIFAETSFQTVTANGGIRIQTANLF